MVLTGTFGAIVSNDSCMTFPVRRFGYVEFASEEIMQKALQLDGKKVMGQEVKLEMPRSKESSQEGKKGIKKIGIHNIYVDDFCCPDENDHNPSFSWHACGSFVPMRVMFGGK